MAHNSTAKALKDLHVPGKPLTLTNVWDVASLNTVLSLNASGATHVKAIATASWAIATAIGVKDEDLTFQQNLDGIQKIAQAMKDSGLPLSVDLQDGYGQTGNTVRKAIELGAHGANIEDSIPSAGFGQGVKGSLYTIEHQVSSLKEALQAASDSGCVQTLSSTPVATCSAWSRPRQIMTRLPWQRLSSEAKPTSRPAP